MNEPVTNGIEGEDPAADGAQPSDGPENTPPQPLNPMQPEAKPPWPDRARTASVPTTTDGDTDGTAGREPWRTLPQEPRADVTDPVGPGQQPQQPETKPYVPIAALTHPGHLPSIDSVANLFAGPTGPVTIQQTHEVRTADLLETVVVPREQVLADASYVEAGEWQEARRRGAKALDAASVVFFVVPRRYGGTTFSLRLLAEETGPAVALQVVEPSWDRPLVSRLPVQADAAYLLDLRDPERDRIDRAFLTGLSQHADSLKKVGSHLVITITPELWSFVAGQLPADLEVVRLSSHPKADQVVQRHVTARGRADLMRYLNDPQVQDGITGWNPARAVWLVDEMIALVEADARTIAEEGADPAQREDHLLTAARELAEGWTDVLNNRFADNGQAATRVPEAAHGHTEPLDIDDRCLSLALAVRGSGPVTQIQADAERLVGLLAGGNAPSGGKNGERKGAEDLRKILGGVGLRTRFQGIGAEVRFGDAKFVSPKYGDALLAYVWDQYHPLHERLVGWMMSCGGQDGRQAHDDPAVRALLGVLTYHQDDSQLAEIRKQGAAQGKRAVAAAVLAGAARDEHLGRRARQLLYSWADHHTDTQRLVVAVCRELIGDQPLPALTRLRRVADNIGDGDEARKVSAEVLGAFREIVGNAELTEWFATTVADWQKQAGEESSHAVSLGTLALMSVDVEGRPWLLAAPSPTLDVALALRGLFVDLDRNAGVIEEIARWTRADGGAMREQALALVQEAVTQRVGFRALARLIDELGKDRTADGSSTGSRMADILGDDPDIGGFDLGASPA
ncbi:hypothetical protein ACIBK8_08640 [Streptomyces sp. NPDC050161]|uniref:hypothetical protein n=1 Tax=Streptomyces sp. NPDC050161 TaxID=3365604 RepID=UPI00379AF401